MCFHSDNNFMHVFLLAETSSFWGLRFWWREQWLLHPPTVSWEKRTKGKGQPSWKLWPSFFFSFSPYFVWLYANLVTHTHACNYADVCVCVCAMHMCVCFANVIVKCPALLLSAVEGCYRNRLYYHNMHTNLHLHAHTSMHTHIYMDTYVLTHTHVYVHANTHKISLC